MKLPAMPFYTGDWLKDTGVHQASFETRGVWIEMLVRMWDSPERGVLEGTPENLSLLLGCPVEILNRAVAQIDALKIGDVKLCQTNVRIENRRMVRDEKEREYNRLAQQRHRGQGENKENVNSLLSFTSSFTITDIENYFVQIGSTKDEGNKFYDYFQSNGWKISGKTPMRDWKAAARNWVRRSKEYRGEQILKPHHTCQHYAHNSPYPCGKVATKKFGRDWLCDAHYERKQFELKDKERGREPDAID